MAKFAQHFVCGNRELTWMGKTFHPGEAMPAAFGKDRRRLTQLLRLRRVYEADDETAERLARERIEAAKK